MKLYYLQCKQFQLVDSMMLIWSGQHGIFSGTVEIFFGQRWPSPLEKMGLYAFGNINSLSANHDCF